MDFTNVLNSTYTLVLLVCLLLSFVLLCLYYGLVWMKVGLKSRKGTGNESTELPSVSVVMVAHNEAEMLKKSLPYLLEQDYPDFEVVVVDYLSQDDTKFVLRVCKENYACLKPVSFHEDVNMFKGKKYPLSIGIKSATKDVILLTDPDCVPTGFDWIRTMVSGYRHGVDMVLGYGMLTGGKGLLGDMQQYENMTYSASYLGMALMGAPYAGIGRNLSYKRKFFFDQEGFISHYSIPDGADDLFVNQNAKKENTAVILDSNGAVNCEARETMHQWHQDRLHRYATHRLYKPAHKLLLSIYPVSQYLFLASILWLWIGALFPWQILTAVLAVKIVWQIVCAFYLSKVFKVSRVYYYSPFLELYFLITNTFLTFFALRKKNKQWR